MARYFYSSSIQNFLKQSEHAILGSLVQHYSNQNLAVQQNHAWQLQIPLLKESLELLCEGQIFLEFAIPRMGKRADAVLFINGIVIIIEFKIGYSDYYKSAVEQAEDYALDLKNFHEGSHNLPIIPILLASNASSEMFHLTAYDDLVFRPIKTNSNNLRQTIRTILERIPGGGSNDWWAWAHSRYKPTPTIIQAAQAFYDNHDVEEITRSEAGATNLSRTSNTINQIIELTERENSKSIVFLTGVPGAGKTLAGLNIATKNMAIGDDHSVFLSGNGPLVEVLREALAQNLANQNADGSKMRIGEARRLSSTFIQNIHHFRDFYIDESTPPADRIVVFDEAQRAWTAAELSRFMKVKKGKPDFEYSEPRFLLEVMDRHQSCTVVCLIGGGQEINRGEAGLDEWINSIRMHFQGWNVFYSPSIVDEPVYLRSPNNKTWILDNGTEQDELHLKVSLRSFRSENLSAFVEALINGDLDSARQRYRQLENQNYPLFVSRDLERVKSWLKNKVRGSERSGLVASSGARRLRKYGIWVESKIDPPDWFLKTADDVRSSLFLEETATEFDIQGLELDWVGVCWDADFYYSNQNWIRRKFKGSRWQVIRDETARRYLQNAYRVLLTRARQGMVIFVPHGDINDASRLPEFYDGTYEYLKSIGVSDLDLTEGSTGTAVKSGLEIYSGSQVREND